MTRYIPTTPSTLSLVLVIAMASACGRTSLIVDEKDGQGGISATGAASNSSSGGGSTGTGGSGVVENLPRFACDAVASQQFDPTAMQAYSVPTDVTAQVEQTLSLMTPSQKASQMTGVDGSQRNYRDLQRSPDVSVPGVGTIRGFRYRDGSRGVNLDAGQDNRPDDGNNFATVFPAPSVRAASWDLALERRVGAAIGDETAASRNNVNLSPTIGSVRHPYWGRTQEAYGEDSYHIGRMATAYAVGVQEYVMACARHWAANNIEKARSRQNAIIGEQTLREIYGRQFEMIIQDGGVGCVMAGYNLVNGVKSTQSEHLLRRILKGPVQEGGFGFEGIVLTDWWAMPGEQMWQEPAIAQAVAIEAVNAGTDIELPWSMHYSQANLSNTDQIYVDEAARRVLTQKYLFKTALDTDGWAKKTPIATLTDGSITANAAHEDLAEEAELKSAVLLTNGLAGSAPVLPLTTTSSIAVLGPEQEFSQISSSVPESCGYNSDLSGAGNSRSCTFRFAIDPALGDRASSRVNADPDRSIGPFQGMQTIATPQRSVVVSGSTAEAAADSETIVVVVGYTPGDEGEEYYLAHGGDRSSLNLPPGHNELVSSVLDLNKPTVIIVESGSIVNLPWLSHANKNQATIWAGYPGQRGGLALAKLISGEANFSGKMPMVWPTEDQLPPFKDSEEATEMHYFFGYRELDKRQYIAGQAVNRVFPFGHGLSYSTFDYSNLTLPCEIAEENAIINVRVDITNTSSIDGDEVAMLFVKPPSKPANITGERPWKELKSFARVSVPAGQTTTAELPLRIQDLRRWEGGQDGRWVIDSGDYTIVVGKNAADAEKAANYGTITVVAD